MTDLNSHRQKIDQIDREILKLISQRGRHALQIGKLKQSKGKAIFVPSREKAIYDRLAKLNKGPYKQEAVVAIFREIISSTRALEAPIKVAFLGPEATFTHLAAKKFFGTQAKFIPERGIQSIFSEVEKGHHDYGVVPIENSTEGVVSHTLDMFVGSTLKITSEIILKVCHHLLCQQNNLSKIKKVYSHPHALAQCRNWLAAHLPTAVLKEVSSTAHAAKMAAKEKGSAAIASEIASNTYGLPMIRKEIQDQTQNFTRFLVIGEPPTKKTGDDKTSLLFSIRDKVGGLYKILEPISKAKINLTKIESRPLKKKVWQYLFYLDIDGHHEQPKIKKALAAIEKNCEIFQILGSYPKSSYQ